MTVNGFSLTALATCLALSAAAAAEWQGRVLDMGRSALADAKVTLHPQSITAVTDGNGTYRLSRTSASVYPPPRSAYPGNSPAGLHLGFRAPAKLPARDLAGRRLLRMERRGAFIAPLVLPSPVIPALPLAKGSEALVLSVEKTGYQTARVTVAAAAILPDILLAPGIDLSRPLPALLTATPPLQPGSVVLNSGIHGSTYTDIPGGSDFEMVHCVFVWELTAEDGMEAFVRPHDYFPKFPERSASKEPDGSSDKATYDPRFDLYVDYQKPALDDNGTLLPIGPHTEYVNLVFRKPANGAGYGTMKWLQFLGPIPRSQQVRSPDTEPPKSIRTVFTGTVPPLDTCGRLTGKVVWKGPGPIPELWVGMIGTELFAPIAPDGTFQSTDLPPGRPPVVLVRVDRSGDGSAVPRAFHTLDGLEVISGQTSVLESVILEGEP